jgi:hypothetical protein
MRSVEPEKRNTKARGLLTGERGHWAGGRDSFSTACETFFPIETHTHHKVYFRHIKTEVISLMSGPASFELGPGSCGPFHAGVGGILSSPPSSPPTTWLTPSLLRFRAHGASGGEGGSDHPALLGSPGGLAGCEGPACVLMGVGGGVCFQEDPGVEGRQCVPRFPFG